jgi:hypothetical protein
MKKKKGVSGSSDRRRMNSSAWRVVSSVKFSSRNGISTTVRFAIMKQNSGPFSDFWLIPSASIAHIGAFVHGAPR